MRNLRSNLVQSGALHFDKKLTVLQFSTFAMMLDSGIDTVVLLQGGG